MWGCDTPTPFPFPFSLFPKENHAVTAAATTRALLTRQESADYLAVGLRTIDRMVAEGTLPAFRVGATRAVRIRRADLDAALRAL